MKLQHLKLKNFRQHVDTDIAFHAGLTGVVGTNGAGKTSMVESIAFALYGSKAIRGKVEDIASRNRDSKEMLVELSFEVDGTIYRVSRTSSDAALFHGGEGTPIVTGNREVASRVTFILGMSYEEFIATFLTEQKSLEFLSGKKGAAERERFIVRMMGYDSLETIQEMLRNDRKDKKVTAQGWEGGLGSKEEILDNIERHRKNAGVLDAQYQKQCEQLESLNSKVDEAKLHYQKVESLHGEWSRRKTVVHTLELKFADRTERIKNTQKKLALHLDTIFEGKPLREYLQSNQWRDVLGDARQREKELQIRFDSSTQALHKEELSQKTFIAGLLSRKEILIKDQKLHDKKLKSISTLNTKAPCPTCGQELGNTFQNVAHSAQEHSEELARALLEIDAQLTDVQSSEVLRELQAQLQSAHEALQSGKKAIQRLEAVQSEILTIEKAEEELALLREEIKVIDTELATRKKELLEIRFSEDEYRRLKGVFDATTELLQVARLQKMQTEGDLKAQKALFDQGSRELEKYEERAASLIDLRKELLLLDAGDSLLTDFRKALNEGIKPRLAELAGEFLSELTDGFYSSVQMGADFSPYIVADGELQPVISGGETDILHLSVRLALSQMIAERAGHQLSLLILDEVFGSLDEQRRSNVLHLLERLAGRFEQILVITHMDDIKDGVEHLLYVRFDESRGQAIVEEQSLDSGEHF